MQHRIVSREEWLAARRQHLAREKEFTHARDRLSAERRELPWVRVEKSYRFDGSDGPVTLGDLFADRSQLIVYHFMFAPDWDEGCKSCSYLADHFDGAAIHLAHRDVTLAAVSRAPLAEIQAFRERMGWQFNWVSSFGNDFNRDFDVTFTPDELAKGEVYYNYEMGAVSGRGSTGCECVLPRPRPARSFTPTRPMRAGSTSWSGPTISSTSCPRAETRTGSPTRWNGCGTTIATRMARSPSGSRPAATSRQRPN